jgi:NTP pyrophosphatase (non-canonical NTP hydrolase)
MMDELLRRQREFQKQAGLKIDTIVESERNQLGEMYLFKAIEEVIELRREFPSTLNKWSKNQKLADRTNILNELSDVMLFLMNFCLVWRITPEELTKNIEQVQCWNIGRLAEKQMRMLNQELLSIPTKTTSVGRGSVNTRIVVIEDWPGHTHFLSANTYPHVYFTSLIKDLDKTHHEQCDIDFWAPYLKREIQILDFCSPRAQKLYCGNLTVNVVDGGETVDYDTLKELIAT